MKNKPYFNCFSSHFPGRNIYPRYIVLQFANLINKSTRNIYEGLISKKKNTKKKMKYKAEINSRKKLQQSYKQLKIQNLRNVRKKSTGTGNPQANCP